MVNPNPNADLGKHNPGVCPLLEYSCFMGDPHCIWVQRCYHLVSSVNAMIQTLSWLSLQECRRRYRRRGILVSSLLTKRFLCVCVFFSPYRKDAEEETGCAHPQILTQPHLDCLHQMQLQQTELTTNNCEERSSSLLLCPTLQN